MVLGDFFIEMLSVNTKNALPRFSEKKKSIRNKADNVLMFSVRF